MNKKINLHSFLGGLICGEGCFSFYYSHRKNKEICYKNKEFRFSIDMHERDRELLVLLAKELKCGKVSQSPSLKKKNMIRFEIASHKTNVEKVIPYFDNYLIGYKKKQYDIWKEKLLKHYADRKERRRKASGIRYTRDNKIKKLRKNGLTLQAIGNVFGITRERVRQLL